MMQEMIVDGRDKVALASGYPLSSSNRIICKAIKESQFSVMLQSFPF